jgi:hypothetical protein
VVVLVLLAKDFQVDQVYATMTTAKIPTMVVVVVVQGALDLQVKIQINVKLLMAALARPMIY